MRSIRPLIAGNWKMNLTLQQAVDLVKAVIAGMSQTPVARGSEVMIAPPFTQLAIVADVLRGSPVALGAQDMHWEPSGAYTGEISPLHLKDVGCTHVILGHSERRTHFAETDAIVRRKLQAAVANKLIPIVCIGETLQERESGRAFEILKSQIHGGLGGFAEADLSTLVVAYEPVWAIGTGKTATPDQAQEAHAYIRKELANLYSKAFADSVRILYGGSVTADNIDSIMAQPDVDGALVGGASLKPASFLRIIHFKEPAYGSKP